MSRIYFHQREGENAEIRGSERAYMAITVSDLAMAVVGDRWSSHKDTERMWHGVMNFFTRDQDIERIIGATDLR